MYLSGFCAHSETGTVKKMGALAAMASDMNRSTSRRGRPRRDRTGAYGLVLISIIITIVLAASLGRSEWGRWFVAVAQGATVLLTFRISGTKPGTHLLTSILVAIGLAVSAIFVALGDPNLSHFVGAAISALLVLGVPMAIARGAIAEAEVTPRTVLAALSIYLLVGLFFAFAYGTIATVIDGPFYASGVDGALPDHLYFSFATLTTVGYGDFTAAEDIGRMASVLEALIGQLYLVTVVAVLVGNLIGRRRG
jgi:Ion channel